MNKIVAVVVTYNRKELLKECILALLNQSVDNLEILIVDNASTDGTYDYIHSFIEDKKIIYRNTGKNIGGAGGFNYGMKVAYELGCDFMWLMDDDCIVSENTLSSLLKTHETLNGKYGFLSSKVLWKDNSLCRMNIQKKNLFSKNTDWTSDLVKITMATFVSFFIKTSVVKDVGLPISEFFIWADDLEYSNRISKKYPCYLVNSSVVTHKSKFNIGSNLVADESNDLSRYSFSYRNECYIAKHENIIGKAFFCMKFAFHKYKIKQSSSCRKNEKLEIINKAIREGDTFNPKIEYLD